MKRFLGINLLVLTLLVSCTEEEFFAKDYLETFQDQLNYKTEVFTQQDGNNKVDILWVVDNSGSMANEQAALGDNFNVFIQDFIAKDVDFKMAITTTDSNGVPVAGSLESLSKQNLLDNQAQFIQDFKDLIKVGTSGSGTEQGLKSGELFTTNYAANHFRADAYYVVVYVSDEKDQSPKTKEEYLANLKSWKEKEQNVKAYSIVNMNPSYSGGYARYKFISDETNGTTADINNNFHQTLSDIGEGVASLAHSFILSNPVLDPLKITIKVNGITKSTGWNYNQANNAIEFDPAHTPEAGSSISVRYKWQEETESSQQEEE